MSTHRVKAQKHKNRVGRRSSKMMLIATVVSTVAGVVSAVAAVIAVVH